MLGAIVSLLLVVAVAYAVTKVGGIITLLFVGAVLFLAYRRLSLLAFQPPALELEIECHAGFYVRSLAHDLGQALGCGAHLRALSRTRVGPFSLSDSLSLEELEQRLGRGNLPEALHSLDAALLGRSAVILAEAHATDVSSGRPLKLFRRAEDEAAHDVCRAYSTAGELIALLRLDGRGWAQPFKVFPPGRRGPNLPHPDDPSAVLA